MVLSMQYMANAVLGGIVDMMVNGSLDSFHLMIGAGKPGRDYYLNIA